MRTRGVYIWALLVFGLLSFGSPHTALSQANAPAPHKAFHFFLHSDSIHTQSEERVYNRLSAFTSRLEKVKLRSSSDLKFLKTLFFRTHRKILHDYSPDATLEETLTTGKYGCLSGTALYSFLLSHFNYKYEIIELPGHVYLKVHLKDQTILMESTLAIGGFITDAEKITMATEQYEAYSRTTYSIVAVSGINTAAGSEAAYVRQIDLEQLSGLQYYNMAIYSLRDGAYAEAFENAKRSKVLYPSNRTKKLMEIVINKILQSKNLTKRQKDGILSTYISQVKNKRLTQR